MFCCIQGLRFDPWIKKCQPPLTRWLPPGGIESFKQRSKDINHSNAHNFAAGSPWRFHIKTWFLPKNARQQQRRAPEVLNSRIACRAGSSNRPISRGSDWPIFSCLGSSRWKTLAASRRPTTLIRIQPTPTRSVTNQTCLHCKLQPSWFRSTEPPHT